MRAIALTLEGEALGGGFELRKDRVGWFFASKTTRPHAT